jgi:transcriptional regulator with XRE-family HTH domain
MSPGTKAVTTRVGARIADLRRQEGWSQEDFALECNINRSAMGSIERGESNVTLGTLLTMAERLKISLDKLFAGIA